MQWLVYSVGNLDKCKLLQPKLELGFLSQFAIMLTILTLCKFFFYFFINKLKVDSLIFLLNPI